MNPLSLIFLLKRCNKIFYLFSQAVKISPHYDVFITKRDFKTVKNCSTSSSVVRSLVASVFADKALEECSVSGKRASNGDDIRTALHQDGIDAIIGKNILKNIYLLQTRFYFKFLVNLT